MQDMPQAAVLIRSLNKWFGNFHVLKDIDLTVENGSRIVVCGPSGSGKSTLVRCLNGLEAYQQGDILLGCMRLGHDAKQAALARRRTGMVFQNFNLFPHLSVLSNCTLALRRVLKLAPAKADEIALHNLERVKVAEQMHKFPAELSGGQQQRVAIARALCLGPRLMLFDEPTSALDPEMIKEVLEVMIGLASDGMTMVCVTHEMGFAREIASRIVFMDEGRIVEEAAPQNFFAGGGHQRSRAFLETIVH